MVCNARYFNGRSDGLAYPQPNDCLAISHELARALLLSGICDMDKLVHWFLHSRCNCRILKRKSNQKRIVIQELF